MAQTSSFFALISRMKYIERWALMRSSHRENLSEHSLEVALIAHALCTIGNVRYGHSYDANMAAVMALFHDASEIITGDMPTPIKYANGALRDAYKDVEAQAEQSLLALLPSDLQESYQNLLIHESFDNDLALIVKAADKLSALIKCLDEKQAGNSEFVDAQHTIQEAVDELGQQLPEVNDFVRNFLPLYGHTLDQLLYNLQQQL